MRGLGQREANQARASPLTIVFDAGEIGVILIGMPGLEKKLTLFPQFIHGSGSFMSSALWRPKRYANYWISGGPPGVHLPKRPLDQEAIAAIIRITGGNFRLLSRLLTQMERILEINSLQKLTKPPWRRHARV
jgi:hypothetical protein